MIDRLEIMKETLVLVFSGLAINFPLNILVIYLLIDVFQITSALTISIASTFIFTVVALIRVYLVRLKTETKKLNKGAVIDDEKRILQERINLLEGAILDKITEADQKIGRYDE